LHDPTVDALMTVRASTPAGVRQNLAAVKTRLTDHHRFKLQAEDLRASIVYSSFYAGGPSCPTTALACSGAGIPCSELQRETDGGGRPRGYLASEANFRGAEEIRGAQLVAAGRRFRRPKTIVPSAPTSGSMA
jgi:hypothetical protein